MNKRGEKVNVKLFQTLAKTRRDYALFIYIYMYIYIYIFIYLFIYYSYIPYNRLDIEYVKKTRTPTTTK